MHVKQGPLNRYDRAVSARNPYLDQDLSELVAACNRRFNELELGTPRTPDQRRDLARDTQLLLLALARVIDPGHHTPNSVSWAMQHARLGLAETYLAWAREQQRIIRHVALVRASEQRLGLQQRPWFIDHELQGTTAGALAVASDDGLRAVLELLESLPARKGRKGPAPRDHFGSGKAPG